MKKLIIVAFLAILFAGISAVHATKPEMWYPLHISCQIASFDSNTNQADLEVRFSLPADSMYPNCTLFQISLSKVEDLLILNEINGPLDFSSDSQLTKHVFLQLYPGKIATLMIEFDCPEKGFGASLHRWFSIKDTLAMWTGFPYHLVKEGPTKVDYDTLSAEKLAEKYEIRILLRKDSDKEKARRYFGRVPEIDSEGFATMTMPLNEILKLGRETNLEMYVVNPAEWMNTTDSPNHPKNKN